MRQSSPRHSFLDSLLDPTAIAILGSIALHATIGASLPFFTQPQKEPKKANPGTVKVVELSPSELQRIPQAPQPPIPQALPPVTQPIPSRQPPTLPTPQFSTAPVTIPFSPIRLPLEKILPKATPAKKERKSIAQKRPSPPKLDTQIDLKPSPKPSKPPIQKKTITKPLAQPTPTQKIPPITKISPSAAAPQTAATDDDGAEQPPTISSSTPDSQPQQPAITQQPATGSNAASGNDNGFYGKYTDAALKQLGQFMKDYDVKEPYPSKSITRSYPEGMLCSKEKQAPFIVMMAVFDRVPKNSDAAILGEVTAPSLEIRSFKEGDSPEQRTLAKIAEAVSQEEANKADQNRPEKDKGKRVIYQYRVQFDPATCKK
jgi:hypothetical protein